MTLKPRSRNTSKVEKKKKYTDTSKVEKKKRYTDTSKVEKKKSVKKVKRTAANEKESVQLVAQEISFVRSLSGNDKKNRDKVLKKLRKWLSLKCESGYVFKEEDFNRIWKGLFYSMWMSDKPLIQEELSESISALIDIFPEGRCESGMLFFKCGLKILATEWFGLDQHRMDKFLMFVRRLLRSAFRCIGRSSWTEEACQQLSKAIGAPDCILSPIPPAYAKNSLALMIHVVECYAEELAKVSEGEIPDESLVELLKPLGRCMALTPESRLSGCIKRHVFVHLLKQSDEGIEYEQKKLAWIKMGCPEGGVDCLVPDDEENSNSEEGSDDEEIEDKTALDPRAGRVNTLLPSLPVPARSIADMLRPLLLDKTSNTANRQRTRVLLKHFEELASGDYPLRVKEDAMAKDAAVKKQLPKSASVAKRLHEFEKKMIAQSDELAIRGLSRKHRKRVLAKTRERLSSGDLGNDIKKLGDSQKTAEKSAEKIKPKKQKQNGNRGEWEVEEVTKQINDKKVKATKRKVESALADEVPLKKLKNILEQKELNRDKTENKNTKHKSKIQKPDKNVSEKKSILRGKNKDKTEQDKSKADVKATPKKVTIVLKNNTAQGPIDYYKSVRQSPSIPFDSTKKPAKTNLKPNSTPSPINPFFKKKFKLKF